jgi:predicted GNAT family N-acyltransferase
MNPEKGTTYCRLMSEPQRPLTPTLRVKRVSSRKELEKAFGIRMRVFVTEQGVPKEIEMDRDDKRAFHFLAFEGNQAVGTARVVMRHRSAKIGRMAVLKNYRGRGIGRRLLRHAVLTAKKQGAQEIYLHAQVPVIGFYEAMAFRCVSAVFKEAGIPHRKMVLTGQS